LRIYKNQLVVPVLDEKLTISSLQFIGDDGSKKFPDSAMNLRMSLPNDRFKNGSVV